MDHSGGPKKGPLALSEERDGEMKKEEGNISLPSDVSPLVHRSWLGVLGNNREFYSLQSELACTNG